MRLTLPEFNQARVLILGDVMLDRYWTGPTSRISPEAPVPVVKVEQLEDRPGGAANVALNVAALGSHACLIGLVGDDAPADALEQRLAAVGIESRLRRLADTPTITKLRVMSRQQQLIRLDFEEPFAAGANADLQQVLAESLKAAGVLILSDYAKGTLEGVEQMIEAAKQAGVPVLVDPKGTDFERYRGATLLTPNLTEFEAVVGRCKDEHELVERGQALCERLQLDALLVTRSEHGMTLLRRDLPELHLPAEAQEVFDVTGAGDTVISTLGSAIAAGASLEQACALANTAAAIVVGKLGTSTVSDIELGRAIGLRPEVGFGSVSEQQLIYAVQAAKARGERVVMTNGCFDILHAGHVSYLEQAAELGDRLIVAVNSDRSVRELKGEGRPVNPADRRMSVLAGLASVDWVVEFDESTPARLIGEVLPDLLVKGGDYKPEEIAGAEAVWANGGEVKVLGFENGCSTTAIINTIRLQD